MMCTDAGFHPDQARRHVGEPRFHLAARPLLSQRNRAASIKAYHVNEFLPISTPITATAVLSFSDMACSLC
jgi:hypothetical protein